MIEFSVASGLQYFVFVANPTLCGHVAKWIALDTEVSTLNILNFLNHSDAMYLLP